MPLREREEIQEVLPEMNSPEDRMREADWELVGKALDMLSEHFDSVQIFTTRCESGMLDGTIRVEKGSGNWFARYGQVKSWMKRMDEQERMDAHPDGESD